MEGIEFRRACETDLATIRDLADRIWRSCYAHLLSEEQIGYMLQWMYSEEALQSDLHNGMVYELIVRGEQAAGYLSYSSIAGREWKLHKLYLLPEFHGAGFGQRALRHVTEDALVAGVQRLSLNVNKGNARAIRAYERAGFVIDHAVVNDIGGGFVMDDFVMTRELGAVDSL